MLKSIVLNENIQHIEDLPLREFIRTVEALKDKVVTEKIDGNELAFGIDDKGFFTSRELKSPKKVRCYKSSDYDQTGNSNSFRAAHTALEKEEPLIRKYLKSGDLVETEVLFGRQPNTVTYGGDGKNYIVILRGVNGTPNERVENLAKALNKKSVHIKSSIVNSPDGDKLDVTEEKMTWKFVKVNPIDSKQINTKQALQLLGNMKEFIAKKNSDMPNLTNQEVAELNLNEVSRDKRDAAHKARRSINDEIMKKYKEPIKELLLNNFVRKIKPFLQDKKLDKSEDIGVEGVVVRDPITGSQTKIVDKDVFTAINTFNSAVRNNIAGLTRTTNADAAIEQRGGAFGEARIKIADLLGASELALSSGTRRYITQFKKSDPMSTAVAVAQNLNISSLSSTRTKISTILVNAVKKVNSILGDFKKEAGEFKLELKTGKHIGITPEVMKRTLTAFAETKKEIADINERVLKSRTAGDLIMALYGKIITSIFDDGESEVKESLIQMANKNIPNASDYPISPVAKINTDGTEKTLKGSKLVTKRVRKFVRPKKFPLPKEVANTAAANGEDPAGLDEMIVWDPKTGKTRDTKDDPTTDQVKNQFASMSDKDLAMHFKNIMAGEKVSSSWGPGSYGPLRQRTQVMSRRHGHDSDHYWNRISSHLKKIEETADGGTTSAGAIAPFMSPLNAKTGPISRIPLHPKKKKKTYSLISAIANNIKEDWAHVADMKFATDVDDSAYGRNDVEFNNLRNTAIPDNPTPMDVNRYLDKAHDINDEVDTVTFGMENADGSIAKVYVNAAQADEFEKALAYMLGQESDTEEVINQLANKFDIVDVEWPQEMMTPDPTLDNETPAGPADQLPPNEVQDDGMNYELEPEATVDGASTDDTPEEGNDDNGEDADETNTDDDGVERDDFGQIITGDGNAPASDETDGSEDESDDGDSDEDAGEISDDDSDSNDSDDDTSDDNDDKPKKKKKKKKDDDSDDEQEDTSTDESLIKSSENMIVEAGSNPTFANPSLQAVSDMLIALGFDPNVNQSFVYQAKQLVGKNTPGLIAAKQTSVAQKIGVARDALSQALQVSAGSAPPAANQAATSPVTQSFKLLGSLIAEKA